MVFGKRSSLGTGFFLKKNVPWEECIGKTVPLPYEWHYENLLVFYVVENWLKIN